MGARPEFVSHKLPVGAVPHTVASPPARPPKRGPSPCKHLFLPPTLPAFPSRPSLLAVQQPNHPSSATPTFTEQPHNALRLVEHAQPTGTSSEGCDVRPARA